jgi:PhoH-like ATPase
MVKTYILDTNVLLHNPHALRSFADNHVVIPFAVIEEIDNQKRRQDEIGRNARLVSQMLDKLRGDGPLSTGVLLKGGGKIRVEINHQDTITFPKGLDPEKCDNRILALAHNLHRENNGLVTLVTKDLNLRIKADVLGIPVEDFNNDTVDYHTLYSGYKEIHVASNELNTFYQGNALAWEESPTPYPNEFVILRNFENGSQSALCRYYKSTMHPLKYEDTSNWGIRPRNKEQKFGIELLLDDSIKVVTMVGTAGTGKTLLALAVGLEKVIEKRDYRRFLIIRPVIPMGDDIGYLPGTKEEKLRPWMQPIYDNLDFLFRDCSDGISLIEEFRSRGNLEMETFTYIRGRSIPNQFILCDEAQNLTPNMIKTLVTRVGEGTKIVFTGDPEQIDHPYLDACSNGLSYLVEKMKGEDIAGHIALTRGERSEVAELGARLLR